MTTHITPEEMIELGTVVDRLMEKIALDMKNKGASDSIIEYKLKHEFIFFKDSIEDTYTSATIYKSL